MRFFTPYVAIIFFFLFLGGISAQNQFTALLEVDSCANWIRASFSEPIDENQTNFIFLYQHRGASIQTGDNANFGVLVDLNGAGRMEVNHIAATSGDTLFLANKIKHDYLVTNAATMVVLQTDLDGTRITEDITAPAYNGTTGGIIFLASSNELEIDANLNADGAGYAGGESSIRDSQCGAFTNANDYFYDQSNWRGAFKGQSLTFPAILNGREMGRGPNLTGGGGGNDHNAGGGGGGNAGAGGNGAQNEEPGFFNCSGNFPGLGGNDLSEHPDYNNRLFFGGGGGAGHGNNPNPTAGGNGGGIIVCYARKITFEASMISAIGHDAEEVDGDGGGGGGAGGDIYMQADSIFGDAFFNLFGGNGGNVENNGQNRCFGPGGGGGGGRITLTTAIAANSSFISNNTGGVGGISLNSTACPNNSNRGAAGTNGIEVLSEPTQSLSLQEYYGIPALITPSNTVCPGETLNLLIPTATSCLTGAYFQRNAPGEAGLTPIGSLNQDGSTPLSMTVPDQDSLVIVFRQYLTGSIVVVETEIAYDISPAPTASFIADVVDFTLSITSLELENTTEFSWDFGDGNTSTIAQPTHVYEAPGMYTVCLTFANACSSDEVCAEVEVLAPASFLDITTNNLDYCVGDTIFMVNNSLNVSELNWSLSPDNGDFFPASFSEMPYLLLTDTGSYQVTLNAISNQGLPLTTTTNFSLSAAPVYSLSSSTENFTVTFMATGDGSSQFSWEILGEVFPGQEAIAYTFPGPGTYQATFTATNDCGTFVDTVTVQLFNAVNAVVATPVSTGCAPLTARIFNESSGDFTSVEWMVSRVVSQDSLDFTGAMVLESSNEETLLRFDSAGFYEVQLLISGPGGTDSVIQNFSISEPPIADFNVIENGGFIQLINLSTNADTYLWNFGDGNTSMEFQPTHQYLTPDTYNINLNATNTACGRATSQTIVVDNIVSTIDPVDAGITISPNPGNGRFILASPAATYEVFDQTGRLVIRQQTKQRGEETIDLLDQAAGVYLLIINVNKKVYTKRLIKE